MIRKSMPPGLTRWVDNGFPKRSCATKHLERDVDPTLNHRALAVPKRPPECFRRGCRRIGLGSATLASRTIHSQKAANGCYVFKHVESELHRASLSVARPPATAAGLCAFLRARARLRGDPHRLECLRPGAAICGRRSGDDCRPRAG